MTQRCPKSKNEMAISPVVGVMLMLVVTIIIAAVVAGFSGGLIATNNQKAPTLTMDVKIINMGSWTGSGFFATVTSVSEPIPTRDLKIVTSWNYNKTQDISGGQTYEFKIGGNTVMPGNQTVFVLGNPETALDPSIPYVAPFGFGPGINGTTQTGANDANVNLSALGQQFGNYTLMPGTTLSAQPCGAATLYDMGGTWSNGYNPSAKYGYGVGSGSIDSSGIQQYATFKYTLQSGVPYYQDPITSVLGKDWEKLRVGDKVNVKIIHIPTGKVIFQQDIPVTEG